MSVFDGTVTKMSVQPPRCQLFNLRRSAAQTNMEALVSALWCRLFPGQYSGQNHKLDQMFDRMSHWPELATLQLCPYYFDQVTYSLPTRGQVKHMWVQVSPVYRTSTVISYSAGCHSIVDPQTVCFVIYFVVRDVRAGYVENLDQIFRLSLF